MLNKVNVKVIAGTVVLLVLAFFWLNKPKPALAFVYPSGCSSCQTQGSWCAESGSGYHCNPGGTECQTGNRVSDTSACPPGCTCGRYKSIWGGGCGNDCIEVEWCPGSSTPVATATPAGSCVITSISPSSVNIAPGQTQTVTVTATGAVSFIAFSSSDNDIFTTNPTTDSSSPYTTVVTGVAAGRGQVTVTGYDFPSGTWCNTEILPVTISGGATPTPTPTPAPGPAYPVSVTPSKSCSNPGETVTFTATYYDPRGWQDIIYPYLLINSTPSGNANASPKGALKAYLNLATGVYQIRKEDDSAWLPIGTYSTSYATLAGVSFSGNGNTLTVLWQITFLSPWETESANVYLQVTDRTLWTPSGYIDLNDFLANGCATPSPTPTPAGAWWQVKDGDVWSKGNLQSLVPGGKVFLDDGDGGFPGIPAYVGSINSGSGSISAKNWNAASSYLGKTFDYAYFYSLIPSGVVPYQITTPTISDNNYFVNNGAESGGYYWYKFDGQAMGSDLTISANDLEFNGNRKTILFVDSANLILNGNPSGKIKVNSGGFLMVIVGKDAGSGKGEIRVAGSVETLDGIYQADNKFLTLSGSDQLVVTGSVAVAYGSINLNRNLANNSEPAELFIYSPTLFFNYPPGFMVHKVQWREIAP